MTLASMLTEPVTIRRRTAAATDAEGNATSSVADVPALGMLQQQATDGDDRRITLFLLTLLPDVEVDGNDHVVARGRTFEIDGDPYLSRTPRGPHHWEVKLRGTTP